MSNKISSGEKNHKYFISYLYNDRKVKPLHLMVPKTSTYVKRYDEQIRWIYFLIEDDDIEKYNTIRQKVCTDIENEVDSKQACI